MSNQNKFALLVALLASMSLSALISGKISLAQQEASSFNSWMTEKWTGDGKPYVVLRESIDKDFSQGRITAPYLFDLEKNWNHNERNPRTLFCWAYARYKAQSVHPALPFTTMPGPGSFDAVIPPRTYQFTRVRFLTETMIGSHPDLMPLGRRLLAQNPNDFDVEYSLTACFPRNLSVSEKEEALLYSTQLITKYPKKPSVYSIKGGVYFSCWIDHRNKEDAQDAIKWYQQYLKLAPANYEWRKEAKSTIALLQAKS